MLATFLLSASLTFTATATGVEQGTPVEFYFAGKDTDRDYETMFLLTETLDEFCDRLERAGLPRGKPTDVRSCRLWPVGCTLKFEPALDRYVEGRMPEGLPDSEPVYTGGRRLADGRCEAGTNMPMSAFSTFTLDQSPIVYDGIYGQGAVYNCFKAKSTLKAGERFTFTVSWDAATMPRFLHLTARPGGERELVERLRQESGRGGSIDVLLGFADTMTVAEATKVAALAASLDSPQLKFNGTTNLFYRSFLPLVKWRDRRERLVQPFELVLGEPDRLVFIEEDWTVEGDDPKLTPREIDFAASAEPKYATVNTCFLYASATTTVARLRAAMNRLASRQVINWYVFVKE
ncbi:MAG: hypothetical protein ACI4RD_03140 [Kiritimatiellia bacterium]